MLQNHKFSCYNRIASDDDRKHVTNHSGRQCKKRIIRQEYTIINNKSSKCIWNYLWSICEHLQILKLLLSYINEKIYNQINKHLTDTPDSNIIKQKHNYQLTLQSEVQQIQDAIISKNSQMKFVKFKSESDKKRVMKDIFKQ